MLKSFTTRGAIFTWLFWTAALASCDSDAVLARDGGLGTNSDADATPGCVGSLQEVGTGCPATFDGTAEQLPPCSTPVVQSVLACPTVLVLRIYGGYSGSDCFYDRSSHALVGASNRDDIPSFCGNSFTRAAGTVVDTVACTAPATPPVRRCADFI